MKHEPHIEHTVVGKGNVVGVVRHFLLAQQCIRVQGLATLSNMCYSIRHMTVAAGECMDGSSIHCILYIYILYKVYIMRAAVSNAHRIINDRIEKYGANIVFISK